MYICVCVCVCVHVCVCVCVYMFMCVCVCHKDIPDPRTGQRMERHTVLSDVTNSAEGTAETGKKLAGQQPLLPPAARQLLCQESMHHRLRRGEEKEDRLCDLLSVYQTEKVNTCTYIHVVFRTL